MTRHTEMPDALAIFIIGSSLTLILFYYVYLPYKLHKKQTMENNNPHNPILYLEKSENLEKSSAILSHFLLKTEKI